MKMIGLGRLAPPNTGGNPSANAFEDTLRVYARVENINEDDAVEEDLQVLRQIRYQFERNQICRSDVDKLQIFELLNDHLILGDPDVKFYALSLIRDILPHLTEDADECMNSVMNNLILCLRSKKPSIRRTAFDILVVYSKLTTDTQRFIRSIIHMGLESVDPRVSKECLVLIPYIFPPEVVSNFREKNLYLLVAGLGRRLKNEGSRAQAWRTLKKIEEAVGHQRILIYVSKLTQEQKRIYEELSKNSEEKLNSTGEAVVGKKLSSKGWFEYGAIDNEILSKLKDDENIRVRLQGAEELNKAIKSMNDFTSLQPQMRQFLNFLDSTLEEEQNFKMNLLILEIYGILIDKFKGNKIKPHLRTICSSLIKHASNPNIVVRMENFRVIKKLMCVAKPTHVINHVFDHLGDKRSVIREDILNIVIFALLTFPSYEFDLKTIAATVVPTLVDPKRRVRQSSLECVAVLAAFMGPSKAAPLIKSIELLETHFDKGAGVLHAVQARLARRQLPRITSEGLVEYSVSIPNPAGRSAVIHQPNKSYGEDVDWILAGTGSLSSVSAKSNSSSSNHHFDDSLSSTNSFPNSPSFRASPVSVMGTGIQALHLEDEIDEGNRHRRRVNPSGRFRSKSEEKTMMSSARSGKCFIPFRSRTETDFRKKEKSAKASNSKAETKYQGRYVHELEEKEEEEEGMESDIITIPRKAKEESSELPRLTGTKSQASTASSSATRDSGISLNELRLLEDQQASFAPKKSQLISVNDLPIKGKAVSLSDRRFSISSKSSSSRSNRDMDEGPPIIIHRKNSTNISNVHLSSQGLGLLRTSDASPFSFPSRINRVKSEESVSTNSTPFSRHSTNSNSYDYEDDFTSDESDISNVTRKSNRSRGTIASNSSIPRSRIPIKRNSSLRRKKSIMKNYNIINSENIENQSSKDEENIEIMRLNVDGKNEEESLLSLPVVGRSRSTSRERKTPTSSLPTTPNAEEDVGSRETNEGNRSSETNEANRSLEINEESRSSPSPKLPSVKKLRRKQGSTSSLASQSNVATLPLKTAVTLKSPIEGYSNYKVPHSNPEDLIKTALEKLESNEWESNINGLVDAYRLAVFHPELLTVEIKDMSNLVLRQVKNLRSQVCRLAVLVLGEFFAHLKRSMECDVEKMGGTLISKTGDTNKFLREDCHVALDQIVENVSSVKVIGLLTSEPYLHHKNPVIRATVSRLLAYTVSRLGNSRALSGAKDVTDKLLPAVAKLAQDGSQDARLYAKMALRILMEHHDFDRILKKNLTLNTMRNLEKIIDAIRHPRSGAMGSKNYSLNKRGFRSSMSRISRKTL